jgi:hypothetical protein
MERSEAVSVFSLEVGVETQDVVESQLRTRVSGPVERGALFPID